MILFLNGRFVPEEQAVVSVFDRAFLYGDGLFETLCVRNGKPFRWPQHFKRLRGGAEFLGIQIPFTCEELAGFARQLIEQNRMTDAVLRLTLSRGVGPRGYSPRGADHPTVVMTLHPAPASTSNAPPQWKVITASVRLPAGEPLARFKTCNKLTQVLARVEADAAGADEALILNTEGQVIEASSSNLFWVDRATVCTPPLPAGILPGVTRAVVLEVCHALGIAVREAAPRPQDLPEADGVFLTLSTLGVVEVGELDGHRLSRSPLRQRLRATYEELIRLETAS